MTDFYINAQARWIDTIIHSQAVDTFHSAKHWFKNVHKELDNIYEHKEISGLINTISVSTIHQETTNLYPQLAKLDVANKQKYLEQINERAHAIKTLSKTVSNWNIRHYQFTRLFKIRYTKTTTHHLWVLWGILLSLTVIVPICSIPIIKDIIEIIYEKYVNNGGLIKTNLDILGDYLLPAPSVRIFLALLLLMAAILFMMWFRPYSRTLLIFLKDSHSYQDAVLPKKKKTNKLWLLISSICKRIQVSNELAKAYQTNRVTSINAFLPRLLSAIILAWLSLISVDSLFINYFDKPISYIISFGLLFITMLFVYNEISKLNPYIERSKKILSSAILMSIAFIYSFSIGIVVMNFTGPSALERNSDLEFFYNNNIFVDNPNFTISNSREFIETEFYKMLQSNNPSIINTISAIVKKMGLMKNNTGKILKVIGKHIF